MKNLKYLLMASCTLVTLPTYADFSINNVEYAYQTSGYYNIDDEQYSANQYANIFQLDIEEEDTVELASNTLKFLENAVISAESNSDIMIGRNDSTPTYVNFSKADWSNNDATMNFVGNVFAKVNGAQTLFKTTGNVDGKLNVLVANGTGDTELKIRAQNSADNLINSNALYNLTHANQDGLTATYAVTQKSVAQMTDYTNDQAGLLLTMMNTNAGTNTDYDQLTEMAQLGGYEAAVKSTLNKMLNPTLASNTAALNSAKENANLAMARMAGIAGGEEAETSVNLIPWVQGMFNHTNNTQSDGFTANTKGIALGIDAEINNAWMVGIGYSNVNSRIKTDTSSTHGYGDNGFVYGQYKPADWYVRAMAGYGRTTYKDQSNGTKWDVDSYTANAFAGYIWSILDTSVGARYTYLDNKSYKSGYATIAADDTDNLTAVVDFKVSQEYAAKDWMITPSAHVGFTYDVISADNASTVALGAGYGSYEVNGERLHKAGVEAGTGVVFKNGNSEFHLNYEGAFRKDNYSNGGIVKFKYNF